jgi:hypothetical protein
MKRHKWAVLLFVFFLFAGFRLSTDSWKGMLYVYLGEDQRSPAALHHLKDFSRLDAKSLSAAAHDQLIANAEIVRDDKQLGVKLGHFLTRTNDGKREFACRVENHPGVYDTLEMTFVGLGVSDSGELPTIEVESSCRSSADLDWLETIWIPMGEIASKIGSAGAGTNYGFSGEDPDGKNKFSVSVKNMPSSDWPEVWVLTKVRLFHSANPDDSLIVDTANLKPELKSKFTFDWKTPVQQKSGQ